MKAIAFFRTGGPRLSTLVQSSSTIESILTDTAATSPGCARMLGREIGHNDKSVDLTA